jgi:predicted component of type VI protein secretion system
MIKRGKAEKWAARSERLSAALRQNLKRRKEQARGRAADSKALGDKAPEEAQAAEILAPEPQKHRGEGDFPPPDTAAAATTPDFRRNPGGNSPVGSGGTKTGAGG